MCDDVTQRSEADLQSSTHCHLPVEAVLGADHVTERSKCYPSPGGDVEHRQGIVGAKEQAFVNFRIAAELQQHAHAIGQRQGGDIGVEMRVAFGEVLKGRQEFLIEHEPVTTGMACDDRGSFIQRHRSRSGSPTD